MGSLSTFANVYSDDPVELKGLSSLLWNDYAFRFIHCNMPKAVFLVPTGNSMHTSTGFPRFPAKKKVSFFLQITLFSNRNYKGKSIFLRGYTHAGLKSTVQTQRNKCEVKPVLPTLWLKCQFLNFWHEPMNIE